MAAPDPSNERQVRAVATALAIARAGRQGLPTAMTSAADAPALLRSLGFYYLADELVGDAQAMLTALRDLH